ncbi:hypothetical protein SDC9_05625 [bioreactor metagenome]|nr:MULTISPECIES: hypothetical protein [Desulfovibrio]MCB6542867.1 hypothetical protein [Desulfovibrio desulfuricans]MCB6553907.1 hypothetical protein [Desulfovibrio desulfuricans]MCB6565838.1 hypothetical protein [Desulfovibrio desulfuricans]MCB7346951.1 hypothetical protein [Desulfovibrio desulfuricans]MCQ4861692.1 hypothetical protein [Desulfovibrio desulfuricans]
MTICFLPRNFFAALCLLTMFAFGAGCATHQEQPGTPPAADSGAQPGSDTDVSDAPLQSVQVRKGQTVHVAVSGGDASFNADFESMLTSYLQSEKDLTPADSAQKADLLIRVKVEDIYPLGSRNAPVSAGHALGSTATGAMLGVLLGGTTGGRSGAAWGAGAGAALGLGVALLDSSGKSKIWGMKALVGVGRNGREPSDADMHRTTVRAEGANMGKEEILPALEDTLSRKILESLRS